MARKKAQLCLPIRFRIVKSTIAFSQESFNFTIGYLTETRTIFEDKGVGVKITFSLFQQLVQNKLDRIFLLSIY